MKPNLVVVTGLKEPHAPADAQVTIHVIPALVVSFTAVALSEILPLTVIEAGGGALKATAIGSETIVNTVVLLCDGLLVTVAVMVTVAPRGISPGAV